MYISLLYGFSYLFLIQMNLNVVLVMEVVNRTVLILLVVIYVLVIRDILLIVMDIIVMVRIIAIIIKSPLLCSISSMTCVQLENTLCECPDHEIV